MKTTVTVTLSILVSSLYGLKSTHAIATDKPLRRLTRRGVVGTISSGFLLTDTFFVANADDRNDVLLIPPAQPIPFAGTGAPLRPVIVEQTESPWKCPSLSTKLGSRITAQELSPLGTALSPFSENELYYPTSFSGEWNVKATLRRKIYPYGLSFVPSKALIEGSPRYRGENINDVTQYATRFISLDDGPITSKSKIIADRRFNSISSTRAYNQLTPVEAVIWDPKKDPTQIKLEFAAGQLTEDLRPIGPRRAEVYITARKKEEAEENIFAASERIRQVTLGAGVVIVSDSETITEYKMIDDDNIQAVQRIAVFLTPNPNSREGILWQQVGGKSVAFFDYELEMQKVNSV